MHGQSGPPSQPEWRLPPRLSSPSQPGPPPPPRPPVASYAPAVQYSPAAPYSPANYGPISNPQRLPSPSAGADTTTWGVRFNQSSGPPLPPRPSSTNEQRYAYAQSQSYPSVATPFHGIQPSPPPPSYTTLPPPPSSVPQPPPKIPQGTQHVAGQQGDQTGRAPLLAQGAGTAAMSGSYEFRPAPTLNTNTTSVSASALGPGTPSDWEHFGPTPGHFDDAAWFPPRRTPSLHHEGSQPPSRLPDNVPNVSVEDESDIVARPRTDTNQTLPSTVSGVTQSGQGGSNSPVSPCTTHGIPTPPQLVRTDTTSSALSTGGRSESIDDVINAWVRPLSPAHKPVQPEHQGLPGAFYQTSPVERPQSTQNSSSFFDHLQSGSNGSAQVVEGPRRVATPVNQDPFEDLDPWAKSSLERYVAMLRKEAVADLDEERYKIFTAFMAKETKLRQILYNIEPEPESKSLTLQAPNPAPPQPLPTSNKGEPAVESGLIPVASEEIPPSAATATEDEDLDDVGSEYSSGGRPLLVKKAQGGSQAVLGLPTAPSGAESNPSRPLSIISMDTQKQVLEPLTTNPPRPIYTPFQYTEGPQRGSDNLTFARPAYQGYSDLRQAAVSGRVMSNAPAPAPTSRSNSNTALASSAQKDPDETFLGLIRHKSVAYSKPAERNSPPVPLLPETLRQGRSRGLVEELRTILRTPLDKRSESSWHIMTREELEKFPDDFSYIRRTVDQWEEKARARRQNLEHERMARQDESERHIDDLFNGKEIGYADINTLEEEFRQSEARVQLEEERHEVDDFMTHVFNPLDEGLKNEISALRKSYDSALNQLDLDQQSKGSPSERGSPSVTMKIVNDLHKKLEIRFQKRLDIALDCEQRRKRAERRPLVVMGDISGLQKLDGEFDQMERRNILEACKDRDDRANRLMDSFDDAILHGLGLNQSLLDEVASRTARLDTATFRASGLPRSEIGQILKSAATFAASLGADSEAIIRSAGVADMILNDADYGVSVAEARYANSDPEIFHRLGAEKIKEDEKIQGEMNSKLQSIQEGPVQIEATIQRLLLGLHNDPQAAAPVSPVQGFSSTSPSGEVPLHPPSLRPSTTSPGPSPSPAPVSQTTDEDLEHKQRLRRALEAAKQRNAARGH
ncbi:hypothetical protein DTO013E5_1268 [Penicillium roqueforti]|uniref:Genomic scaffold, ProqFM164S01 n=1 Tax=Penicillium roqueforti (strain FM164) TaxID=1365484 RepID=W6PXH3_PENRF|nr:hypothetical protein DTO012A1_21 [Penicillium roqueforti]CDM28923.1 unnamed protein product [Penicillium roqueforti FM164]KAI2751038.1 hypothetical protein DTO013F2_4289 [Penicillium roqueforti]KAI2775100.1 hypothetical protein DTO012A8_585 [Penicillium roqueforti]KAI3083732.1 hypothetical protein CBS147339_2108 [Penicillium roqueforti]